ncbi:hypothetical protein F5Y05DRAFT_380536 [Hypoxylon sp. FL0543]|nr:hypothetical protein F5Y05DRAFT_380536 [Hypoxylon sp. FL0543]
MRMSLIDHWVLFMSLLLLLDGEPSDKGFRRGFHGHDNGPFLKAVQLQFSHAVPLQLACWRCYWPGYEMWWTH